MVAESRDSSASHGSDWAIAPPANARQNVIIIMMKDNENGRVGKRRFTGSRMARKLQRTSAAIGIQDALFTNIKHDQPSRSKDSVR